MALRTNVFQRHFGLPILFLWGCVVGCTGVLGGSEKGGEGGAGIDGDLFGDGDSNHLDERAPPACPTEQPFVGSSVVRRMTNHQYSRTALVLFGDDSRPGAAFPVETREEGYDNQSESQHVQRPQVTAWETAATELAKYAVGDLDGLLGCDSEEQGADACFREGLPSLLRRVLRQLPSADDVKRYEQFYDSLREDATPERATELVLRALLLAPEFIFLVEEGAEADNGTYRLDAFEIATRLSFFFWNQAPSGELLQAAEDGELETLEEIEFWARQLLADDRSSDVVRDFHSQWIDLAELDNMVLPEGFDESVRQSAKNEIEWFIQDWYSDPSGHVSDLFTSRRSFVDEDLAALYGVAPPEQGSGVVELPADQRSGLLTRAVFLGTHGIPPTRGDFVLARVLCTPVPALTFMPPLPPDLGETATTREKFEKHAEDPCAAACHGVLDPVGFAFEH